MLPVTVTLADSDFPNVVFEANERSVAGDAVRAAAEEWDIDSYTLQLSYGGNVLQWGKNLFSLGVEAHSLLVASSAGYLFGSDDLMNETLLQKATELYEIHQVLRLKLSTFVSRGGVLRFSYLLSDFRRLSFHEDSATQPMSVENRYFAESALVSMKMTGLRGVRFIGYYFLSGCGQLTELDITNAINITTVGNNFLSGCISLSRLRLPSSSYIASVQPDFLRDCTSLTAVDLSFLGNATSIGDRFLMGCKALSSLTFSLGSVTTIGHSFLRGCEQLPRIDITRATNITDIGDNFLSECRSLTALAAPSSGCAVKTIAANFMRDCSSLITLDLPFLSNVTSIGDSFLMGCKALTSLNLYFGTVTSIEVSFLHGCEKLTKIVNLSDASIADIEGVFQRGSKAKSHSGCNEDEATSCDVDLSFLSNAIFIGASFLMGCKAVSSLTFSLSSVATIGPSFLRDCEHLTELDISSTTNMKTIEANFIRGCGALSILKLPTNANITLVRGGFLQDCASLTAVDLSFLRNAESIGGYFLAGCKELKSLTLSVDSAKDIGFLFLGDCTSLATVNLSFRNVDTIADPFLKGCKSLTSLCLLCDNDIALTGWGESCSLAKSIEGLELTSLRLSGVLQKHLRGKQLRAAALAEASDVKRTITEVREQVLFLLGDLQVLQVEMSALCDMLPTQP